MALIVSMRANKYARMQGESAETLKRLAVEEEARNRVVIGLVATGKTSYELRNEGTGPAFKIKIDSGDIIGRGKPEIEKLSPGDVEGYSFTKTMQTMDNKVVVTWHLDPAGSDLPESRQFLV